MRWPFRKKTERVHVYPQLPDGRIDLAAMGLKNPDGSPVEPQPLAPEEARCPGGIPGPDGTPCKCDEIWAAPVVYPSDTAPLRRSILARAWRHFFPED
jgi:hypothetical protein